MNEIDRYNALVTHTTRTLKKMERLLLGLTVLNALLVVLDALAWWLHR